MCSGYFALWLKSASRISFIITIKAMSKQIISTPNAPAAIGTYSQAARVGNTIWVSGQIPLDPATKELVKGDMEAQVRQAFENLKAIVIAAAPRSMTWSRRTFS